MSHITVFGGDPGRGYGFDPDTVIFRTHKPEEPGPTPKQAQETRLNAIWDKERREKDARQQVEAERAAAAAQRTPTWLLAQLQTGLETVKVRLDEFDTARRAVESKRTRLHDLKLEQIDKTEQAGDDVLERARILNAYKTAIPLCEDELEVAQKALETAIDALNLAYQNLRDLAKELETQLRHSRIEKLFGQFRPKLSNALGTFPEPLLRQLIRESETVKSFSIQCPSWREDGIETWEQCLQRASNLVGTSKPEA